MKTNTRLRTELLVMSCLSAIVLLKAAHGPKTSKAGEPLSSLYQANQYYDANDFENAITAYQGAITAYQGAITAYQGAISDVSKLPDKEMKDVSFSTDQPQHRIENDAGQRVFGGPVPGSTPAWWHTTPEKYVSDTLHSDMKILQGDFERRWKMIRGNVKSLGLDHAEAMLTKLGMATRDKVSELKAEAQGRTDEIKRIMKLRDQGAFKQVQQLDSRSVDKMLWQVAAGPEVAESMFPIFLKLQKLEDSSLKRKHSSGKSPLGLL
jgi:hypothetical protein